MHSEVRQRKHGGYPSENKEGEPENRFAPFSTHNKCS